MYFIGLYFVYMMTEYYMRNKAILDFIAHSAINKHPNCANLKPHTKFTSPLIVKLFS